MRQKLQWSNTLDCCWSFPGLLTVFWSRRVMTAAPATDPWLVWMPTGLHSLSWTMLEDECSSKYSCNLINGSLPVHWKNERTIWTIERSNYRTIDRRINKRNKLTVSVIYPKFPSLNTTSQIVSRVIVLFQFSQRWRFSSFYARKLRSSSSVTLRSPAELR